jgi:Fe-S-cluster containining protein
MILLLHADCIIYLKDLRPPTCRMYEVTTENTGSHTLTIRAYIHSRTQQAFIHIRHNYDSHITLHKHQTLNF